MQDIDKKILNLLLEDSRQSYRLIAKKLKVSVATVISHVKQMEKDDIVNRYTADLNFYSLGYDIKAVISLIISNGKLFEVERKIASNPAVYAVYDLTGDFDAMILARFKTRSALDKFLKKIQKYSFVERTKTSLILNTIKENQDGLS